MDKSKVIKKVSDLSGVDMPDCEKVLNAFEYIITGYCFFKSISGSTNQIVELPFINKRTKK
ncbi:MAG: hypothetical protein LBV72_00975 [Tannerella sp.]|jgi:hypothetical protein|nr:hypothetical protein [Tannerella sp.]